MQTRYRGSLYEREVRRGGGVKLTCRRCRVMQLEDYLRVLSLTVTQNMQNA